MHIIKELNIIMEEESEKESKILEEALQFFKDLEQHLDAGTYQQFNEMLREQLGKEPPPAQQPSEEQIQPPLEEKTPTEETN